jgi:hypothetical protein
LGTKSPMQTKSISGCEIARHSTPPAKSAARDSDRPRALCRDCCHAGNQRCDATVKLFDLPDERSVETLDELVPARKALQSVGFSR